MTTNQGKISASRSRKLPAVNGKPGKRGLK